MFFAAFEGLISVVCLEKRVHERVHDFRLALVFGGHEKRHAEEQMRRDGLDVPGIAARSGRDVGIVEHVAGAAVDHAAVVAAGSKREVVAFEKSHFQAPNGGISSDSRPVDSSANDDDIDVDVATSRRLSRRWGRFSHHARGS